MPEPFRSLASIFAGRATLLSESATTTPAVANETEPAREQTAPAPAIPDERIAALFDRFVADLARMRARAAERFEEEAESMLADLATRVLARELRLAPPDLDAMLDEALRDFDASDHVVVRVSAADAERLGERRMLSVDPTLGFGDFALDVGDGRYDLALQTRFDAMLASHRVAL